MAELRPMSHGGGFEPRRPAGSRLRTLGVAATVAALLGGIVTGAGASAAPSTPSVPPTTTEAGSTTPSTTTTLPAPVANTTVVVPGSAKPVAVPGVPAVAAQDTAGESAAALLAHATGLATIGTSQAPLESALASAQTAVTAQSVIAAHASAAAVVATAAATTAASRAKVASEQATNLEAALRSAALSMYTGGTTTVDLDPTVTDLDQLGDAAVYESTILSPGGILDSQRAVARALRSALAARKKDQAAALREEAAARRALAAAGAATAKIRDELSVLSATDATLLGDEHVALSSQAARSLTSPGALEFKPASPLPAPLPTTTVALAWIFSELGKPYLWGGTGPDRFDCSGLTQYVWDKAGVAIPRTAQDQERWTVPVPLSQLEPGDLVFYGTSTFIHHVGMYIGDGLMVNAPHTGTVVQVSSIWWTDLFGFGRVHTVGVPVPARPPTPGGTTAPAVVPTAGKVPSESTPPPGYVAPPGATSPVDPTTVPGGTTTTSTVAGSTTTTTTTTAPTSTTGTSTTAPPNGNPSNGSPSDGSPSDGSPSTTAPAPGPTTTGSGEAPSTTAAPTTSTTTLPGSEPPGG